MHEARRVVDRPRRDHDRRRQHRRAEPLQASRATTRSRVVHTERHDEQRHEQDQLRAGQRAERARDADEREPAPARLLPVAVREQQGRPTAANIESVSACSMPSGAQRFGYSAAITAAMMPTPRAADRAPEQPDQPDGARAEHARPEQVRRARSSSRAPTGSRGRRCRAAGARPRRGAVPSFTKNGEMKPLPSASRFAPAW